MGHQGVAIRKTRKHMKTPSIACAKRTNGGFIKQLTLLSRMLCQLQNWTLMEPIFPYGSQWSPLELLVHGTTCFEGILGMLFMSVRKGILVKMQVCTRSHELNIRNWLTN